MIWRWKRFRGASLLLAILIWVLFPCVFAQDASQCTIWVQPGESIQEAIDQAPEGAVICLGEGTWYENIRIERSLALRGLGPERTVIESKEESCPVIWIASPRGGEAATVVMLMGMTIAGAFGECVELEKEICADGIVIRGSVTTGIENCAISGCAKCGIVAEESAHVTVANSTISENGKCGIGLGDSANARIITSSVSRNGKWGGIAMTDLAQAEITDCMITENMSGISLLGSAEAKITSSSCSQNKERGVRVAESAHVIINDSTISKNVFSGIALADSASAIVIYTTVSESEHGMALYGEANAYLSHSTITRNYGGIAMLDSTYASISESNIVGNKDLGIGVNSAQLEIKYSLVSRNRIGISLLESARANIVGNRIIDNRVYGVVAYGPQCAHPYTSDFKFSGTITGRDNNISSYMYDYPLLGRRRAVCPWDLLFLRSVHGGEYSDP